MRKGNLAVLLVFPFVIAFLGVTTVVRAFSIMDKDILDITWEYEGMVGFKISSTLSKLNATPVYDTSAHLAYGNELVWYVENADEAVDPHAEIVTRAKAEDQTKFDYYLKGISEGDVILTVANEKGTVSKSITASIYSDFAFLASPKASASNANIDPNTYYGEYDFDFAYHKTPAEVTYSLSAVAMGAKSTPEYRIIKHSDNVESSIQNGELRIAPRNVANKTEVASVTLRCDFEEAVKERTVSFYWVKDGVNIYDYPGLLRATNLSESGEIVVLRKNFESLTNYASLDGKGNPIISSGVPVAASDKTELFGSYKGKDNDGKPLFSFLTDSYEFKTTYPTEYIDQWNAFVDEHSEYAGSKLKNTLRAGLRVQKDFYGNGYTINMHNLAFPNAYTNTTLADGTTYRVPTLNGNNLFRGPLYTYCLGNPAIDAHTIIALYGQDNVGMLLDGDDITVNDLTLKNCEFGASLSDLEFTGTVLEVNGDNATIRNCVISNGKNVVRAFSAKNLLIQNSLLQNSFNFLLNLGSNEHASINDESTSMLPGTDGLLVPQKLKDYLSYEADESGTSFVRQGDGDKLMNAFIGANIGMLSGFTQGVNLSSAQMESALHNVGAVMSDVSKSGKGSEVELKDTLFYQSGVASIGSEASFNGPFLHSLSPSAVNFLFSMFAGKIGAAETSIVPYFPTGMAFNSYPSSVKISGATDFYDYKKVEDIDLNGLLNLKFDRIFSSMGIDISSILGGDFSLNLDTIFPIKELWEQQLKADKLRYEVTNVDEVTGMETHISVANMVAFNYGGGPNDTTFDTSDWTGVAGSHYAGMKEADLLHHFATKKFSGDMDRYLNFLHRLLETVIGFEPFGFGYMDGSGYNYGTAPKRADLIARATEGSL